MVLLMIILQIIGESLPISSSTHIALLSNIIGDNALISQTVYYASHAPTVIVLMTYFFKELLYLTRYYKKFWHDIIIWLSALICANSITCLGNIFIHMVTIPCTREVGLAITTVLLLSLKFCTAHGNDRLWLRQAIIIGCVQAIALLPGISRLASTFVVGRWIGLSSWTSFRFSCALEATLFAAASSVSIISLWYKGKLAYFSFGDFMMIAGAMVVAYCLLWLVEYLINIKKLWYFGCYTLFITLASLAYKFLH